MKKLLLLLIPLMCIGLVFSACGKKTAAVQKDQPEVVTPAPTQSQPALTPAPKPAPLTPATTQPEKSDNTDKNQGITITTTLGGQVLQLDAIYFDYNSYELRPDAITTLEKSARILKQNPTALISIEGHCDERGTVEYNIALGERRAYSVKNYFIEYGLNPDNLVTISYGKEKPVDPGHDEDAWSKNRRAAIVPNP